MSSFVNLLDVVYPIGSIYMSMDNSANPASSVGGTWTNVTDRFLYASSSVLTSGGYEYEYMDIYLDYYFGFLTHDDYDRCFQFANGISSTYTEQKQTTSYQVSSNIGENLNAANPNQLLIKSKWDNKPPYITCRMWYRTA